MLMPNEILKVGTQSMWPMLARKVRLKESWVGLMVQHLDQHASG